MPKKPAENHPDTNTFEYSNIHNLIATPEVSALLKEE